MSTKVSLANPTTVSSLRASPEPKAEQKESTVKKADNRILIEDVVVANRVKRLAEHNRKFPFECQLAFMLPLKGGVTKKVKLSFNLSVGGFLKTCITNLRGAGFNASTQAKFKGGALSFLIDGHPKTLHDLDLSLRIDPPKDPKDWQKIHEIIMQSLEEVAGLTRPFQSEKEKFVIYKQEKINKHHDKETTFYEEMAIVQEKGHDKNYLLEQPGTVKTTWCINDYFRSQNEQYILYAIPTTPCPIELEIVASHQNSSTCSLDALRIDYPLGDDESDDFYYSAEDGWDPKYILQLRDEGLFDVHKDRIPTIRLGFLRYNAMLLKGYLPTELNFEQLYGQHLASDRRLPHGKTALEDLEENLEKYLNEHCKNFDKKVLYLFISLGTISRLNIAQSTKDRLFALYEKELSKALRAAVSKELIENATLFFYLYFNDFKAHSSEIEKILPCNYTKKSLIRLKDKQSTAASKQLTRVYSKDGKRGDAFVLETTSLPSLDEIREKLRNARSSNPTFAELASSFIPVEDELRTLLGEKIQKQEAKEAEEPEGGQAVLSFPDFAAFLSHIQGSSLSLKKQAKSLSNLFHSNPTSFDLLDEGKKEKIKSILIKIMQTLQDKERALETSICNAAAESKMSFASIEMLFDAIQNSSNPWVQLEFLGKMNIKADKIKEQLQFWEKVFDKIKSEPANHSAIVAFFRHFATFCEKCKLQNLVKEVRKASGKIIVSTINLLKTSKDKEALVWCHQVQKNARLPLLNHLAKACSYLIKKAIEQEDERIVPLYLDCKNELHQGDIERFLFFFAGFLKKALPCEEGDRSYAAIRDGVNHLVYKGTAIDKAREILRILKSFADKEDFPESLRVSLDFLSKYCQGKKEEFYTHARLKQLKAQFIESQKEIDLGHAIEFFRILVTQVKGDEAIHATYVTALELFEEALKIADKTPEIARTLRTLSSTVQYNGWQGEEKARWKACQLALVNILKSAPKKEAKPPEPTKVDPIAELEEKARANPNEPRLWKKLYDHYTSKGDYVNNVRTLEKFIPFFKKNQDKATSLRRLGNYALHIGNLEKGIDAFEKALTIDKDDFYSLYHLGLCHLFKEEWEKAIEYFETLKKKHKQIYNSKTDVANMLQFARSCAASDYPTALFILQKLMDAYALNPDALFYYPFYFNFLVGTLDFKMARKETAGMVSYEEHQLERSLDAYLLAEKRLKALASNPDFLHPDVCLRIGQLYILMKDTQNATLYFERLKKCANKPEHFIALRALAELACISKNWYACLTNYILVLQHEKDEPMVDDFARIGSSIILFIGSFWKASLSELTEKVGLINGLIDTVLAKTRNEAQKRKLESYRKVFSEAFELQKRLYQGPVDQASLLKVHDLIIANCKDLAANCFNLHLWELGLEVVKYAIKHAEHDKTALAFLYAYSANSYSYLAQWEDSFRNFALSRRVSPQSQEYNSWFFVGLTTFLNAWGKNEVTFDVSAKVKPFIDEFLSTLKADELSKELKELYEKFSSHMKALKALNGGQAQSSSFEAMSSQAAKPTESVPQKKIDDETAREIAKLEEKLKAVPDDLSTWSYFSEMCRKIGAYEKILSVGKEIVPFIKNPLKKSGLLFNMVSAHLESGDRDEAIELLEQMKKSYPEDSEILLQLAKVYLYNQNWAKVIENLQDFKKIDPLAFETDETARISLRIAESCAASKFEDAIDLLLHHLVEFDNYHGPLLLAKLLAKINNNKQASLIYNDLNKQFPDHMEAFWLYGKLSFESQQPPASSAILFEKARRIDTKGKYKEVYLYLGKCYYSLSRHYGESNWHNAAYYYAWAFAHTPELMNAENFRKFQYAILSFIEEMSTFSVNKRKISILKEAFELLFQKCRDENRLPAFRNLEKLFATACEVYNKKDIEKEVAEPIFARALLMKDVAKLYFELGVTCYTEKFWILGIDFFEKAYKLSELKPFKASSAMHIAQGQFALKNWKAGLSTLVERYTRRPISPQALSLFWASVDLIVADWKEQKIKSEEAGPVRALIQSFLSFLSDAEKQHSLKPDEADLQRFLKGDKEAGKTETGAKVSPSSEKVLDKPAEIAELEAKLEASPNDPETLKKLFELYLPKEEDVKIVFYGKKCLPFLTNSNDKELVLKIIATSLNRLGQFQEAIFYFKEALKLNPTNAGTLWGLGFAYWSMQDLDNSLENLLKSHRIRPDLPDACMHIAKIYKIKGQIEKAITFFNKVKTLDKANVHPECYLFLAELHFSQANWYPAFWHYAKAILLIKDQLKPIDILKCKFAIMSFINSIDVNSSVANRTKDQQTEDALQTLKILCNKMSDDDESIGFKKIINILKYANALWLLNDDFERSAKFNIQDFNKGKALLFHQLGEACHKIEKWEVGIDNFKAASEIFESPSDKISCHASMAKGYMFLDKWKEAFSIFVEKCKVRPLPENIPELFGYGLGPFLKAWFDKTITPELIAAVKPLIQDYCSFLSAEEKKKFPTANTTALQLFLSEPTPAVSDLGSQTTKVSLSVNEEKESFKPEPIQEIANKDKEYEKLKAKIAELEKRLKTQPKDAELWQELYHASLKINDQRNVIRSGEMLLSLVTDLEQKPFILYNISGAYMFLGDLEQAHKCLKEAVKLDDTCTELFFNLGLVHFFKKEWKEAICALQKYNQAKVKKWHCEEEVLLTLKVVECCDHSQFEEAIGYLHHPGRLATINVKIFLASLSLDIKKPDKAIEYYLMAEKQCAETPEMSKAARIEIYNGLGKSYTLKGEKQKALEYFEKAKAFTEKESLQHTVQKSASKDTESENLKSKIAKLEEKAKAQPKDAEVWIELHNAYSDINDTINGIRTGEHLLSLITNLEDRHNVLLNLATFYLSIRDVDQAIKVLQEALKIKEKDPQSLYQLALAFLYKKDWQKAMFALKRYEKIDEKGFITTPGIQGLLVIAEACAASRFEEAIELLSETSTRNINLDIFVASLSLQIGKVDKALELYVSAEKQSATIPGFSKASLLEIYTGLGKAYMLKGERLRAVEYFEKTKGLDTEKKGVEYLLLLGETHLGLFNWYQAFRHFAFSFERSKGELKPVDLLRLRIALVSFIEKIGQDLSPEENKIIAEEIPKAKKILKILCGQCKNEKLLRGHDKPNLKKIEEILEYADRVYQRKLKGENPSAILADKNAVRENLEKICYMLGYECYEESEYRLGIDLFEKSYALSESDAHGKVLCAIRSAQGYFGLKDWQTGFSIFANRCKIRPFHSRTVGMFWEGIMLFLAEWETKKIASEVAGAVRVLIQDFYSFLKDKEREIPKHLEFSFHRFLSAKDDEKTKGPSKKEEKPKKSDKKVEASQSAAPKEKVEADPKNIEPLRKSYLEFVQKNDFPNIVTSGEKLLQVITDLEERYNVYRSKAKAHMALGDIEGAAKALFGAIEKKDFDGACVVDITACNLYQRDWNLLVEQLESFKKLNAEAFNEKTHGVFLKVAKLCKELHYEEALSILENFEDFQNLQGKMIPPFVLGYICIQVKKHDKAIAYLQKADDICSSIPCVNKYMRFEILMALGMAYIGKAELQMAIDVYKKVKELDTENERTMCLLSLAELYFIRGELYQSIWHYVKYYIHNKGEMDKYHLIKLQFAFWKFIVSLTQPKPPSAEETQKINAVLEALIKKIKDKDLLGPFTKIKEVMNGTLVAGIKAQQKKGKSSFNTAFLQKCNDFNNLVRDVLIKLANESYKERQWQLGIDICTCGIKATLNPSDQAIYSSHVAKGHFNIFHWKDAFSVLCGFCKEKPVPSDFVGIFSSGLSQFLSMWKQGLVDSDTVNNVKPLIEEYLLALKPGEIEKAPEMEKFLGDLKLFISPQVGKKVFIKR